MTQTKVSKSGIIRKLKRLLCQNTYFAGIYQIKNHLKRSENKTWPSVSPRPDLLCRYIFNSCAVMNYALESTAFPCACIRPGSPSLARLPAVPPPEERTRSPRGTSRWVPRGGSGGRRWARPQGDSGLTAAPLATEGLPPRREGAGTGTKRSGRP